MINSFTVLMWKEGQKETIPALLNMAGIQIYSCNLSVAVGIVRSCYTSPSVRPEGLCICFHICRSWSRVWKALRRHFESSGA